MDASPLHSQVKGIAIASVCLLLAIFLGYMVGEAEYANLLLGAIVVCGCLLWLFSGRFFWVLTIASSFLGGTFPILGGQFTPFQILMAMGLAKFVVEDVIIRRIRLSSASRFDLLMIFGFMGVIAYHAAHDRFGMRFLGSDVWGGRQYVNVFVGLAAFFVLQTIPMKRGLWAKFPLVVLAVGAFDLSIAIITSISPNLVYFIYPFYSAVSNASLQEALGGPVDVVTQRIGAFGNFGFVLITIILAGVSLKSILHPANFFRLFGTFVGGLGVLLSGYRSSILNTFLLVLAAGIRDLRAGALLLLPVIAALFFTLSVVNSEIMTLPKQIQRGLVFLPGDWDVEMAMDARGSNDFRFAVWGLWREQYFPKQPFLGRGFGFKSEWTQKSLYYGNAADYRQMVEVGNIHNGLFAALDTFGLVGTLFFVAWNLVLLFRALRTPFDSRRGDHLTLRFLALYLAVSIVSYWIGASSVGSFLPQEFALAGLFLRLQRDLRETAPAPKRPEPAVARQFRRTFARV